MERYYGKENIILSSLFVFLKEAVDHENLVVVSRLVGNQQCEFRCLHQAVGWNLPLEVTVAFSLILRADRQRENDVLFQLTTRGGYVWRTESKYEGFVLSLETFSGSWHCAVAGI